MKKFILIFFLAFATLPTFATDWLNVDSLLATARSYLGVRYARGGTSRSGFDCSGLVMHCFQQFGVSLPHHAASMASEGKHVRRSELQPGDLVLFNRGKRPISHVGIFLGTDSLGRPLFIHSSTSNGVIVSSLTEPYWNRSYKCARRLDSTAVSIK